MRLNENIFSPYTAMLQLPGVFFKIYILLVKNCYFLLSGFMPRIKEKTLLAVRALYPIYSFTNLACSERLFSDVPLIKLQKFC